MMQLGKITSLTTLLSQLILMIEKISNQINHINLNY